MERTKSHESLYASSLIEASLDPLIVISTDGKITDINQAMIRITGIEREKLIDSDFYVYFTEPQKARNLYQEIFAKGFIADSDLTFRNNNGKLTNVLFNGSVYKDESGKQQGAVVVARDTAEQKWARDLRIANEELAFQNDEKEKRAAELIIADKELVYQTKEKKKRAAELIIADKELVIQNAEKVKRESANKKLEALSYSLKLSSHYSRSLIEASLDPLFTISPEGKITDMNQALTNITGLTREELKGSDFFHYFTEPKKAREVYQIVFAKGSVADSPLTLCLKDGKLTDVLINGSVYKDDSGNVLGVVVVARDITDQKKFEHELIEAKIKAEKATRKAEESTKFKDAFLANMSHEIRTPMNAIIGFSELLSRRNLDEQSLEYVRTITLAGENLLTIINDILDISKIEAGMMTFEEYTFSVKEIFKSLNVMLMGKAKEKNLELIFSYDDNVPDSLLGDPTRLTQIIINLVGNAIKFTDKGKVELTVKVIEDDSNNRSDDKTLLEFSIKDTGIGICPNKMEQIFERFRQAESQTTRKYGGTGLGLSIAKQLVELQNGTISVQSELKVGSVFTFRIAYKKSVEVLQATKQSKNRYNIGDIRKLKILLVEDNQLNVLLIKSLFSENDLKLETAENGSVCIEKLQSTKFDIILMDMEMPVMNGYEATTHIRTEIKNSIPIIAMTAHAIAGEREKCLSLGMNDYISKPINANLLFNKIYDLTLNL
jgi:PAS domain S-box-containing protein